MPKERDTLDVKKEKKSKMSPNWWYWSSKKGRRGTLWHEMH